MILPVGDANDQVTGTLIGWLIEQILPADVHAMSVTPLREITFLRGVNGLYQRMGHVTHLRPRGVHTAMYRVLTLWLNQSDLKS